MARSSGLFFARGRLLIIFSIAILALFTALRLVLLVKFLPDIRLTLQRTWACLIVGLRFDLAALAWMLMPFWLWLLLIPDRWVAGRVHGYAIYVKAFLAGYVLLFLSVTEYLYFQEFNTRFDFVAFNYLIYPYEVFVNIGESYPVLKICLLTGIGALILFFILRPFISRALAASPGPRPRLFLAGTVFILLANLTVSWETSNFSSNRVLNQIGMNGFYSFVYAAWNMDLDYHHYYADLPEPEAFSRIKKHYDRPGSVFVNGSPNPIERDIAPAGPSRQMNVVIIIEESLGMELLGPRPGETVSLTPEIDALAARSLFFTNFYATGNRTDRGLEAILASFPPIPGKSILRRKYSDHIQTLAGTLGSKGYQTRFVYGGRGMFDGMRPFMLANGFQKFIEQKDYEHPTHVTSWGVCDEDIFHKSLVEFDELSKQGKPFLGVILTTSNHRPFTYPRGRVSYDPDRKARHHAVAYADWAIGDFFRQLRTRDYDSNTIVVLLGDHGPRVTGSQDVPIRSYEVPLIVRAPKLFPHGRRIDTLGSSMDVTPTVLGLLGIPYRSVFFGHDLLGSPEDRNIALMSHNLDVAWFDGRSMIMLGIPQRTQIFKYDPLSRTLTPDRSLSEERDEAVKNAVSFFQTGCDLYYYQLCHPTNEDEAARKK